MKTDILAHANVITDPDSPIPDFLPMFRPTPSTDKWAVERTMVFAPIRDLLPINRPSRAYASILTLSSIVARCPVFSLLLLSMHTALPIKILITYKAQPLF